eukprot:1150521-Pelagomonas_calceolata.AAC.5
MPRILINPPSSPAANDTWNDLKTGVKFQNRNFQSRLAARARAGLFCRSVENALVYLQPVAHDKMYRLTSRHTGTHPGVQTHETHVKGSLACQGTYRPCTPKFQ